MQVLAPYNFKNIKGLDQDLNQISSDLLANSQNLTEAIRCRQMLLSEKLSIINHNQQQKINQIKQICPSKIRIYDKMNYAQMKQLVHQVINSTKNDSQNQEKILLNKNKVLQLALTQKMEQLDKIDQMIVENKSKLELSFCQLQNKQEEMKGILLRKGSIEEAQLIEHQQKKLRQFISKYKAQVNELKTLKKQMIQQVLNELQKLHQCRLSYIEHLQTDKHVPDSDEKLNQCISALNKFLQGLEQLDELGEMGIDSEEKQNTGDAPVTVSTTRNSPIRALTKGENNRSRMHLNSIQSIIQRYEQIIREVAELQLRESMIFSTISENKKKQLRKLALQKVYFEGIMELSEREVSKQFLQQIIKDTSDECKQYIDSLKQYSRSRKIALEKVQSIQNMNSVFQDHLKKLKLQPTRKRKLIQELTHMGLSWKNNSSSQQQKIKINEELETKTVKKYLLQKSLQQYAQEGNLEKYKQATKELEIIKKRLKLLEQSRHKIDHEQNLSKDKKQMLDRIIGQNADLIPKIQFDSGKNVNLALKKVLKRLQQ